MITRVYHGVVYYYFECFKCLHFLAKTKFDQDVVSGTQFDRDSTVKSLFDYEVHLIY